MSKTGLSHQPALDETTREKTGKILSNKIVNSSELKCSKKLDDNQPRTIVVNKANKGKAL